MDSCITQIEAQGPSRTCTESKEEESSSSAPEHAEGEHEAALLPAAQPSVPALHQHPLHPVLIMRGTLQRPHRREVHPSGGGEAGVGGEAAGAGAGGAQERP